MKKILIILTATIAPSFSVYCMKRQSKIGVIIKPYVSGIQKFYSTNTHQPLSSLPLYKLKALIHNKSQARNIFQSALFRYEETEKSPIKATIEQQHGWKKILNQFSIHDWNIMFLEREKRHVLATLNPDLPQCVEKVTLSDFAKNDTETQENILETHHEVRCKFNAQKIESRLQKYYQDRLQQLGYSKNLSQIFFWNVEGSPAHSIHPYIYINYEFFKLPLIEQLGVLAHEQEHIDNYHMHEEIIITKKLNRANCVDSYLQFSEKEADLKACTYGGHIVGLGLLEYFIKSKQTNPVTSYKTITHPSTNERIRYISDIVLKLKNERNGFSWNPFYKSLGLPEWLEKKQL